MKLAAALALLLAACSGKSRNDHKVVPVVINALSDAAVIANTDAGALPTLPPAPALPTVPLGLPALPTAVRDAETPEQVALGELLFFDPRLAADGKTSCASCHDPDHDFSGKARDTTAAGQLNLRHTPSLSNLAWAKTMSWAASGSSLPNFLAIHWRGQLDDVTASISRIKSNPVYRAHFRRAFANEPDAVTALAAVSAYVDTRYSGNALWDQVEHQYPDQWPAQYSDLAAGYGLFIGRAQCASCHTPPLFRDGGVHRLGLIVSKDEGRGSDRRYPNDRGAFATPGLRGAALRSAFFHDGSATTLEAAIDWHLNGGIGQGADPSIIDPMLKPVKLTDSERKQLITFVRALTPETKAPYPRPTLP